MEFEELLEFEPYSLKRDEKDRILSTRLMELTRKHLSGCREYSNILHSISYDDNKPTHYSELPFLPVRLFKEMELKSVPDEEILKTMTSSGTTGQKTSKIFLDKKTAANQQKAMAKIVADFTGASRMPMIIIDCPSVIKDRTKFSARGAGIIGFSIFGTKKIYALDNDMQLNIDAIRTFLSEHEGERILMFGFTYMIWQHFYKELMRLKNEGECFDLSNAVMIHGGGWKKLISEAVSQEEFKERLKEVCGLVRVHDYYGMVEQTGSIYMQCECGHLHTSIFSDVITRRYEDFSLCKFGEKGLIQVVSSIPESYPGHSLLTEDEGVILGEDDCPCGRKGKYFTVLGRVKSAEIRGCSDTYAESKQFIEKKESSSHQKLLSNIQFLVGDAAILEKAYLVSPRKPFDGEILDFCENISKKLLQQSSTYRYSDIASLGFWLRRASLKNMKNRFLKDDCVKLGRGVLFHVAPSNVPVNFAYSLFAGLITGNMNLVRVPSKPFPQIDIITSVIEETLEDYPALKSYISLFRYERDKAINDYLSNIADVRVVWGGDSTIDELRKSNLKPRATEVNFADRYSIAVIDSSFYLEKCDIEKVASDFYNDTYLMDQNACTSPRVVIWYGDKAVIENAEAVFWNALNRQVEKKYSLSAIQSVDKLTQSYKSFAKCKILMKQVLTNSNNIYRICVDEIESGLMEYRGNSGYFYEYATEDVMDIRCLCDDARCQSVGMIGSNELLLPLLYSGIKGIDRVVTIGHMMDFDLLWDGYNLVDRFTRNIVL